MEVFYWALDYWALGTIGLSGLLGSRDYWALGTIEPVIYILWTLQKHLKMLRSPMLAIRTCMANNTAIVIILKKWLSHQGRMGGFVDRVFTPV